MASLSQEERKNAFRAASANGKSALWQVHFAEYKKAHPELSPEQIKVIEEAATLANPIIFSLPSNQVVKDAVIGRALQKLKEHALVVFPKDEARMLFAQIGPITTSSSLMTLRGCGCNTVDAWCSGNYCRNHAYTGCSTSSWGCGTLLMQECNGDCP